MENGGALTPRPTTATRTRDARATIRVFETTLPEGVFLNSWQGEGGASLETFASLLGVFTTFTASTL